MSFKQIKRKNGTLLLLFLLLFSVFCAVKSYYFTLGLFMSFSFLSSSRSIYRHLQCVTLLSNILDNCPARVVYICSESYHVQYTLALTVISRSNECLTLAKLSVKTFVDGLFFAVISPGDKVSLRMRD